MCVTGKQKGDPWRGETVECEQGKKCQVGNVTHHYFVPCKNSALNSKNEHHV